MIRYCWFTIRNTTVATGFIRTIRIGIHVSWRGQHMDEFKNSALLDFYAICKNHKRIVNEL